jgi:hypothetical protein
LQRTAATRDFVGFRHLDKGIEASVEGLGPKLTINREASRMG